MATVADRVFNFSAGPAVLPLSVLERARDELLSLPGVGMSVLEISHRSKAFDEILERTLADLGSLLGLGDDHELVLLQGGASLQFAMVPLNLLSGQSAAANYILTGTWGKSGLKEAKGIGPTHVAWDGEQTGYDRLPEAGAISLSERPAYVHLTSNETIQGVQWRQLPDLGDATLVCDCSSDFLSRPVELDRYGILYACAQKNAGPAGVTVVIIRDDLVQRVPGDLPSMLSYRTLADAKSLFNTPPVFAVYFVKLVTDWLLKEIGGLDKMHQLNQEKAKLLYGAVDQSGGFYSGHAEPASRSIMNVTFRLPSEALESQFLQEAESRGLTALKGHRSVGGCRASIYNAMPIEGVTALRDFMLEFHDKHAQDA
jgi:phosphoserine aminotransferase